MNLILRWFNDIEQGNLYSVDKLLGSGLMLPDFMLKTLCSTINSMDAEMLLRADVVDSAASNATFSSLEGWNR